MSDEEKLPANLIGALPQQPPSIAMAPFHQQIVTLPNTQNVAASPYPSPPALRDYEDTQKGRSDRVLNFIDARIKHEEYIQKTEAKQNTLVIWLQFFLAIFGQVIAGSVILICAYQTSQLIEKGHDVAALGPFLVALATGWVSVSRLQLAVKKISHKPSPPEAK